MLALAESFLEAGLLYDAEEFFRRAASRPGLDRVKKLALEQGDSFLFGLAVKGTGEEEDRRVWEELGNRAMELKKYSHAVRAFRKAGSESLLESAQAAFKALSS